MLYENAAGELQAFVLYKHASALGTGFFDISNFKCSNLAGSWTVYHFNAAAAAAQKMYIYTSTPSISAMETAAALTLPA